MRKMSDSEKRAVVIDDGSGYCKVGFVGEDAPRSVFPSIVGTPKHPGILVGKEREFLGTNALVRKPILKLSYPIERGVVTNWENMEKIWQHAFYDEVCVEPENHPVILTEPPLNPKATRERMAQIMFETFKVPAISINAKPVLSLYASGRTTGVVLDSGHCVTVVTPVYKGHVLSHAVFSIELGGRDLNDFLMRILTEAGLFFNNAQVPIEAIKEDITYVALDFEEELDLAPKDSSFEKLVTLPGGEQSIGSERFRCPEVLFQPSLAEKAMPGVHELLYQSVMKCDEEIQEDLFANILLAGGSTMFQGMAQRVEKEISALIPTQMHCNVIAPPDRRYSAWLGASMLASQSSFDAEWITEQQYESSGPTIVHRK